MYKPTFLAFTTFAFVLPLSNGRTQKPIVLRSNAGFVGRVSIGAVLTGPSAKYVPAKYLVLKGIDTKAKRSFTGMRYFATTSKVLDNSEKQSAIDLSVGGFLCFGGSSSIRDYAQSFILKQATQVVEEGAAAFSFLGLDMSVAQKELQALLASGDVSKVTKEKIRNGFLVVGIVREVQVRRWLSIVNEEFQSLNIQSRKLDINSPFVNLTASMDEKSKSAFWKRLKKTGWHVKGVPGDYTGITFNNQKELLKMTPFKLPNEIDAKDPGEIGVITRMDLLPVRAILFNKSPIFQPSETLRKSLTDMAYSAFKVQKHLPIPRFKGVRLQAAQLLDKLSKTAENSWNYSNSAAEKELANLSVPYKKMLEAYNSGVKHVKVEYRLSVAETQVGHGHTPVSMIGEGSEFRLDGAEWPTHEKDRNDTQYRGVWVWVVPEDATYKVHVKLHVKNDCGGRRWVEVWTGKWGKKMLTAGRHQGGGDIQASTTWKLKKGNVIRMHMMGTEDTEVVSSSGSEVVFVRFPIVEKGSPVEASGKKK